MSSPGYVFEKFYLAICALCDDESFENRLEAATVSALYKLSQEDLEGEMAEDLKFVLSWTSDNIINGKIQKVPNETERKELIEKMLHVMLETYDV